MSTISNEKFKFVKRDDFASEAIDAPAYSYWGSVFRQFMKKEINNRYASDFDFSYFDEFHLSNVL